MKTEQTRRDTLKQIGVVAGAAGASIPVYSGVASAASDAATLTLTGTIPSGTDIAATIEEYDTSSASNPVVTQTKTITETGSAINFGDLDAQEEYYYLFDLQFNSDGSSTPELDALLFEVPKNFESTNYTTTLDWQAKPDEVSILFDEQYLWQYQPMLVLNKQTREAHKGMYGYVAKSPERETDALYYWNQFTHQNGLPGVRADTHLGDHEPIVVFVDSETGDVVRVSYSDYHWFKGTEEIGDAPEEQLATVRLSKPSHPVLSVSAEWHNYEYAADSQGAFLEMRSWPAVRETWVKNGFYSSADIAAIENPWSLQNKDGWWREGSVDHRVAGIWARLGRTLGWFGGAEEGSNNGGGWW